MYNVLNIVSDYLFYEGYTGLLSVDGRCCCHKDRLFEHCGKLQKDGQDCIPAHITVDEHGNLDIDLEG